MTMIFFALPCPTTVAVTRAPSTTGEPTFAVLPSATRRTLSRVTDAPGSACSRSTFGVPDGFCRTVIQPGHLLTVLPDRRALQLLQRRTLCHPQPLDVHALLGPHPEPPAGLLFQLPDPPISIAEEKRVHIGLQIGQHGGRLRGGHHFAQLAADLHAHGLRRKHPAAALTVWTRHPQDLLQVLVHALTGNFHQPQAGQVDDVELGAVAAHRLVQCRQHLLTVLLSLHVDEVDKDDTADVTQRDLADRKSVV